jgi:hypothetical protein
MSIGCSIKNVLCLAFVRATHNHFVLDRGGKVFKQTAPVIKLPAAQRGRAPRAARSAELVGPRASG